MSSSLLAPRRPVLVGEVHHGDRAVRGLLPRLDDLAAACALPVTGRRAWVRASIDADPTRHAWAVVVRDEDGDLRAGAVLLDAPGGSTVLAGSDHGYPAAVAARDEDGARALGAAIARETRTRRPRGALDLGPLPDTALTRQLATAAGATVTAGAPVPRVHRTGSTDVSTYLSAGKRKTLRKAHNRLATDGRAVEVAFTHDPHLVLELLPEMELAYRDRDREHHLPCLLDSSAGHRLWRQRIHDLLHDGYLEVATLTIDGEHAAYVVGLVDADSYRVLEGRFATRWARYAPGRLVEAAVLQRVLDDPATTTLDWMTGTAPDTLLAANASEPTIHLTSPCP